MRNNRAALFLLLMLTVSGCPSEEDDPDAGAITDLGEQESFCPTRLKMSVVSGGIVHVGWTGATHNNRFPLDALFTMEVKACDDSCRSCTFEGPIPDPEINLQRCITDTSVPCNSSEDCPKYHCIPTSTVTLGCANSFAPCQSSEDCQKGVCASFLGANSPSPIRPNCFGIMFWSPDGSTPVNGRIDLETGLLTFNRFGLWIVASDLNLHPGYCPVCSGDPVRNDGLKQGTCSENPHGGTATFTLGNACDAHSNNSIPHLAGIYSLDCAVPMAPSFDLTTRNAGTGASLRWILQPGEQPICADGPCWCGVCENDAMLPCHDDSDCSSGAACLAQAQPGVPGPYNNRCVDECLWDNENLTGTCHTVVETTDAGEPVLGEISCLPRGESAEIVVRGSSERLGERAYTMVVATVGCAGPSVSPVVSYAIGLPGPNVSVYRLRLDLE